MSSIDMSSIGINLLPITARNKGNSVVHIDIDPKIETRVFNIEIFSMAGDSLGAVDIDLSNGRLIFLVELNRVIHPDEKLTAKVQTDKGVEDVEVADARGNGREYRIWVITGFHYDPVWWNTQSNYLATGEWMKPARDGAFGLIDGYLRACREDVDYKFVLEQVPYLKPYWDAHPEERAFIRELIKSGRLQILGGMYNEAQTTLVGAEANARNFLYGCRYMESVYGAPQEAAWQSDVFGHDPNFPQYCARAGLRWASFARGPFHHYGVRPNEQNLPSEFRWYGPDGSMVLNHHMSGHYDYYYKRFKTDDQAYFDAALAGGFIDLRKTAATNNICCPILGDFAPPLYEIAERCRSFNARYEGVEATIGTFRDFTNAVEAEATSRNIYLPPVTRDFNPVLSGCNITFADTKLAERAAENALLTGETIAAVASLFGAKHPSAALSRAWRQLIFCAHHDAITGSEGGEVYLHLLSSWRSAWYIGNEVKTKGLDAIIDEVNSSKAPQGAKKKLVVFNPHPYPVSAPVNVEIESPPVTKEYVVVDSKGNELPTECEGVLSKDFMRFIPDNLPPLGWKTYWLKPRPRLKILPVDVHEETATIENGRYCITADASRGGCLTSIFDKQLNRELLRPGGLGAEVVVREEYPGFMRFPGLGEGPAWMIFTNAKWRSTSDVRANLQILSTQTRNTIIAEAPFGSGIRRMIYTLHVQGADERLDVSCEICAYRGMDELITLDFDFDLPGAKPFSEVSNFTSGRSTGWWEDVAEHPYPLNFACHRFCGLGALLKADVRAGGGGDVLRSLAAGEVVYPAEPDGAMREIIDDIVLALYRRGVSTSPVPDNIHPYGDRRIDSNVPDFRLIIGGPSLNARAKSLAAEGKLHDTFNNEIIYLDIKDDCPVIVLNAAGGDALKGLVDRLISQLDSGEGLHIGVSNIPGDAASAPDWGVAVFNRGNVDFIADGEGRLSLSLYSATAAEPGFHWMHPPERRLPDGNICQSEHWSHRFEFALTSFNGDIRNAGLERTASAFNRPPAGRVGKKSKGKLPGEWSLFKESAKGWELSCLKAPCQVDFMQQALEPDNKGRLILRLYENRGERYGANILFNSNVHNVNECDLIEHRIESDIDININNVSIPLKPHQMRTLAIEFAQSGELADAELSPEADPPPPHFSAYWHHDRHEAPTGNMPQSLLFKRRPIILSKDGKATVEIDVVNSAMDLAYSGEVEIIPPENYSCEPSKIGVAVAPMGAQTIQITLDSGGDISMPRWLWASMEDINGDRIFDIVRIGSPGADDFPVEVKFEEDTFGLKPGEDRSIDVTVENTSLDLIPVHIELIGPFETWEMFHSDEFGFYILKPEEKKTIHFVLKPGVDILPGNYFVFLKVMAGDMSRFSEPIDLWHLTGDTAYVVEGWRELIPGERCIVEAEILSKRKLSKRIPRWSLDLPFHAKKVEEISRKNAGDGVHKMRLKLGIMMDSHPGKDDFAANLTISTREGSFKMPLKFTGKHYAEIVLAPELGIGDEFARWESALTPLGLMKEENMRGIRGYDIDNLGVWSYLGWRPDGLYIACRVRDNVHDNINSGAELWYGDCLQVGFMKPNAKASLEKTPALAAEYMFALTNEGLKAYCSSNLIGKPQPDGGQVDMPMRIERIGQETFYQVIIPAEAFGVSALEEGEQIRFNLAMHDADKQGWNGAGEWARGSVLIRNPLGFGAIKLVR